MFGQFGLLGAAQGMLGASGPSPLPVGLGQVAGAGLSGLMGGLQLDQADQQRQQRERALGGVADVVGRPQTVKAAWHGAAAPAIANSGLPSHYFTRLAVAESGNRNIGQQINDTGTAFGPFQFTAGTWSTLIRQHPELGLREEDRMSPEAQGRAIVPYTLGNQTQLKRGLGRDPSLAELKLAHRFGGGGALALLANRGSTVGQVLPAAAAANPQWAAMKVSDVLSDSGVRDDEGDDDTAPEPDENEGGPSGGLLGMGGLSALAGAPPQPFGSGLANMTPDMREILQIALRDPTLGPAALQTVLQMAGSTGGAITPAQAARLNEQAARTDVMRQRLGVTTRQAEETARMQRERLAVARQQQELSRQHLGLGQQQERLAEQRLSYEQQKPLLEEAQKQWTVAVNGAASARPALDQLDQLERLNNAIHTGKFAGTTRDLLNWAQSAGIDPTALGVDTNAAPYEAFQAIASNMAMHLRNPPGQSNLMPGQMSNYEDQLLQSMGPQLSKSPQGNAFLIKMQRRIQQRAIDFGRFATQWQKEHGNTITPAWFEDSTKWWEHADHQLMTPALQKELDALSQPGPTLPSIRDLSSMTPEALHALPADVKAALSRDPQAMSVLRGRFAPQPAP